jgi:hypothetical protein
LFEKFQKLVGDRFRFIVLHPVRSVLEENQPPFLHSFKLSSAISALKATSCLLHRMRTGISRLDFFRHFWPKAGEGALPVNHAGQPTRI